MKKKLSSLLLSVLVLGVLAIPVNSITASNGNHATISPLQWTEPDNGK